MSLFKNRADAGQCLARELSDYAGREDVIVIALPRGGVRVGFEVAKALNTPLDVVLVQRLGVPGKQELAMGAIASGGALILNRDVVVMYQIVDSMIEEAVAMAREELERRERIYRAGMPPLDLEGKTVILVDDGLATGASMRAALAALRPLKPAHIVVAVPTAQARVCDQFENEADGIVCAMTPVPFLSVGIWYIDFSPVRDEEMRTLLEEARSLNRR